MTRVRASFFVVAFATIGSALSCSPALRDGWYACTTTLECPSGFSCSGGRCHRSGGGAECRVDAHCDDGDVCTLDICEGGLCSHDPESGSCDDGDFCNGPDECSGGRCANVGPPPCPDACDQLGCGTCGSLGSPCCGDRCAEGTCDAGTCVECGLTGGPCCTTAFPCVEPDATCGLDGFCTGCGTSGAPCCEGGFCSFPLTCGMGGTCDAAPECGVTCPSDQVCFIPPGCLSCPATCSHCGLTDEPCCGDGSCIAAGTTCDTGTGTCTIPSCGALGQPCCGTLPECGPDLACSFGAAGGTPTCEPCGRNEGDPCCPPGSGMTPCPGPGLTCDVTGAPICVACGGTDQRCCEGASGTCTNPEDVCVAAFCRSACGAIGEPCCALMRCADGARCMTGMCASI